MSDSGRAGRASAPTRGLPSSSSSCDPPDDGDEIRWDVPKARRCLRCEAPFQSAWSGERICGRCKSSDAWRRGEPPPTPQRSRRPSSNK